MNKGNSLDVLILVLAALSTYRLSVLISVDIITEPLREFWQKRWPGADFFYPDSMVEADDLTQLTGKARAWPFKRDVIYTEGFWRNVNEYRLGALIECFYCVSVWVAFAVTVATYESMNLGYDWQFVLNFLGIAVGAEIINNVFSREKPTPMPKVSEALTAANYPSARSGVAALSTGSRSNMFAAHGIQTATQQEISEKQRLAWDAYDNVPEVHFLGNGVIGASIETLSFYPALDDAATAFNYAQPVEASDEYSEGDVKLIHFLTGGLKTRWGQQSDLMRALGINLFFPAEVYMVSKPKRGTDEYTHELIPKQNIILPKKADNNKVIEEYKDPITGENVKVGDPANIQRIWRPHPANPNNADSPMFAVLEILEELKWIQRLKSSILRKRVMTSGLLIMTNSILGPDFNPQDQTSLAGAVNKVEKSLIDQMNRNIQNDSDSPALPLLGFVPFEHVKDGFNLIDVAGDLPEMLLKAEEAAQRRLANGVDVPAEFLLGMGGSSHWSAYLIRDLLWQQHIFPLAGLIASSLTDIFLRPALRRAAAGGRFDGDPDGVKLWFRSNQLQTHPEIFTYLITAYDKGIIGKGPILAALGIPREAAITDEELRQYIQLKLAGMGTTDEIGEGSELDIQNGTVVLPNGVFPSPSRTRSGGTVSGGGPADRDRAGEDGPSQR